MSKKATIISPRQNGFVDVIILYLNSLTWQRKTTRLYNPYSTSQPYFLEFSYAPYRNEFSANTPE